MCLNLIAFIAITPDEILVNFLTVTDLHAHHQCYRCIESGYLNIAHVVRYIFFVVYAMHYLVLPRNSAKNVIK